MSKSENAKIGRERILRCLVLCGGDFEPIRNLAVQNKYFEEYGTQLGQPEFRKLFGKSKFQQILQEYFADDVEIAIDTDQTGVLFLKMKRPLEEALAAGPKTKTHLTLAASKEPPLAVAKIVPLPRPIGHEIAAEAPPAVGKYAEEEAEKGKYAEEEEWKPEKGKKEGEAEEEMDAEKILEKLGIIGIGGGEGPQQKKARAQFETKGRAGVNKKKVETKKKAANPILTDSEGEEDGGEEQENDGKMAGKEQMAKEEIGGTKQQKTIPQQQQQKDEPSVKLRGVKRASHAEKYLVHVQQKRLEKEKLEEQEKEKLVIMNSGEKEEGEEEEQADTEDEWDEIEANGNKISHLKCCLYAGLICTIMHAQKSITLSKLHCKLCENYAEGPELSVAFPDQGALLEFIRKNCKNIQAKNVAVNKLVLSWGNEADEKFVHLLMKIGKVMMAEQV